MKQLRALTLLIALALLLVQCQKPMSVLGEKKMRAITKELLLTEAYLQHTSVSDSLQAAYYSGVFYRHNVTKAKYDSSMVWYSANAHRLADIYSQINTEIAGTKAELDTFYLDSIQRYRLRFESLESLWSAESRLYIPPSKQLFAYSQTITNAGEFGSSDTLIWRAQPLGTLPDSFSMALQLLITNQEGYRYAKLQASSLPRDTTAHLVYRLVMPDSLPPSPRYTLYLLLSKSRQPLFLHQISLVTKKQELESQEEPAEEELAEEIISPSEETPAEQPQSDSEVETEYEGSGREF